MVFEVVIYDYNSPEKLMHVIQNSLSSFSGLRPRDDLDERLVRVLKQKIDEQNVGGELCDRFRTTIEQQGGKANLGLFTGSTPLPGYRQLVEHTTASGLSWAEVKTFNMDEYEGLPEGHPERYDTFMWENLLTEVGIPAENVHFPGSDNYDTFDNLIQQAGGIHRQGGGMGSNTHMAFNEPGSSRDSRTRRVLIDEQTIKDNARFFDGDISQVPVAAYSVGIATLMGAEALDIYVTGSHKAPAAQRSIMGPVGEDSPASFVQEHAQGAFILDGAAAELLIVEEIVRNYACSSVNVNFGASDASIYRSLDVLKDMPVEKLEKLLDS